MVRREEAAVLVLVLVSSLLVFRSPVFAIFDISQQWLDRILWSERGPPIIFLSLSTPKLCNYLNNGWLKKHYFKEDPPVFCGIYLHKYFREFRDFLCIFNRGLKFQKVKKIRNPTGLSNTTMHSWPLCIVQFIYSPTTITNESYISKSVNSLIVIYTTFTTFFMLNDSQ